MQTQARAACATACAAAPRFLQTLARAGSRRAASGRFLKTLGQHSSSWRSLVTVARHSLVSAACLAHDRDRRRERMPGIQCALRGCWRRAAPPPPGQPRASMGLLDQTKRWTPEEGLGAATGAAPAKGASSSAADSLTMINSFEGHSGSGTRASARARTCARARASCLARTHVHGLVHEHMHAHAHPRADTQAAIDAWWGGVGRAVVAWRGG